MSNKLPDADFFEDKYIFPDYPSTGPLAKYRQNCRSSNYLDQFLVTKFYFKVRLIGRG